MTVTNLTPPVISGIARQGSLLTTTTGNWTHDLEGISYTYRWLRCDAVGANCTAIAGQTRSNMVLTASDVGSTIRSEVTATEFVPPPPPPPGSGTLFDQITDFNKGTPNLLNPGTGNYRITEVATAKGPGFRFIVDFPGGSGNGVQIIDGTPTPSDNLCSVLDQQNYLGATMDLSGWIMFPSSGNTGGSFGTGFPDYYDWCALWEYGPGYTWNNQWGVVGPTRQIYVRSYLNGAQDSRRKAVGPTFSLDTWHQWRWVVKSSEGASGFVKFYWNGTDITGGAWTGPTQPVGNPTPWIQWGFYCADIVNNEVYYADVRLTTS